MAVEKFELKSLVEIDGGRINAAFMQALQRCERDCGDRPATSDSRKVTLTAELTPICSPSGELESVDVRFQIKDTVPTRKSAVYNMKATRAGLLYNELSPDDVNQRTIDEAPGPSSTSNAG